MKFVLRLVSNLLDFDFNSERLISEIDFSTNDVLSGWSLGDAVDVAMTTLQVG